MGVGIVGIPLDTGRGRGIEAILIILIKCAGVILRVPLGWRDCSYFGVQMGCI